MSAREGNRSWFSREGLALLTDLYELTMMAGYLRNGKGNQRVAFDYFFRSLPPHAGFGVMAGLEGLLNYLENLRFEEDDIDYLRSLKLFDEEFITFLSNYAPQFDVKAVPEGSLVFPFVPVVQVEGTVLETQLIETALLNLLNFQTLIATKAARVCLAANGDPVLEFGLRRAQGPDGGLSGSRAAYIGGCTSTSNTLAGKVFDIPVAGTHAHSWVMSFNDEYEAFRAFAEQYPERCVLLVDTYDTVESGVPNAIRVFKEMQAAGQQVRPAIRLDSGDLAKLSKIAHAMMTEAGLNDPLIVASNDLDEDLIADLKRQGAKINAWGVGTHLITAFDCPALGGVYKLVSVCDDGVWQPRMKLSSNIEKSTDPGRKQLIRYFDRDNHPLGDVLYMDGESFPTEGRIEGRSRVWTFRHKHLDNTVRAEPILQPVFQNGKRLHPQESIEAIRTRAASQIAALPEEFKRLRNPEIYQVLLSNQLGSLKDSMLREQIEK